MTGILEPTEPSADGGLGGMFAGGAWGLCGLLYVEHALLSSIIIALAVVGIVQLNRWYLDYTDATAPIPAIQLPRVGKENNKRD